LLEKQGIKLEFSGKGPSLDLNWWLSVSKTLFYHTKRLVWFQRMRTGVIVYVDCWPLSSWEDGGLPCDVTLSIRFFKFPMNSY